MLIFDPPATVLRFWKILISHDIIVALVSALKRLFDVRKRNTWHTSIMSNNFKLTLISTAVECTIGVQAVVS